MPNTALASTPEAGRSPKAIGVWVNLLGYQSGWFVTVIGANHGRTWPAWAAAGLLCGGHMATSDRRGLDVRLGLSAALLGTLLDGLWASSGLLRYSPAMPAVPLLGCPLWILALWIAFSTTVSRSLGWLRGRIGMAALLGAVGGPLAYWGAARGWGVVAFSTPAWEAVLALGAGWGMALGILVSIFTRWSAGVAADPAPSE